ncbi:MAG TPA: rod shape-determining protein MreC [bacterium]|nr:rod shape-determining protein MreC [bacterium]
MYRFLEKKYKELIVALILLLVLVTVNSFHKIARDIRWYDRAVIYVTYPAQYVLNSVVKGTVYFWENYIHLKDVKKENDVLNKENAELRYRLQNSLETESENLRLRNILQLKEKIALSTIPAEVISRDAMDVFKTVRINKGSVQGITPSMPVISYDGVVGQIMRVFPEYSDVLLITDPNSTVDAVVEETRSRGVIEGTGADICRLKYMNRLDDVRIGNRIMTSGMEQRFPKGILIGIVTDIQKKNYGTTQKVIVEPSVDFNNIEEVLVVTTSLAL